MDVIFFGFGWATKEIFPKGCLWEWRLGSDPDCTTPFWVKRQEQPFNWIAESIDRPVLVGRKSAVNVHRGWG